MPVLVLLAVLATAVALGVRRGRPDGDPAGGALHPGHRVRRGRLRAEGLHAVQAYLERVWGDAARRFTLMAENTGPAG
jgi:hypothetical protein